MIWESMVNKVVEIVPSNTQGGSIVHLLWNDGSRSTSIASVAFKNCPSKVLKYYSQLTLVYTDLPPHLYDFPSWENHIWKLFVLDKHVRVHWKDGSRTKESLKMCKKKCPLKLLEFFEFQFSNFSTASVFKRKPSPEFDPPPLQSLRYAPASMEKGIQVDLVSSASLDTPDVENNVDTIPSVQTSLMPQTKKLTAKSKIIRRKLAYSHSTIPASVEVRTLTPNNGFILELNSLEATAIKNGPTNALELEENDLSTSENVPANALELEDNDQSTNLSSPQSHDEEQHKIIDSIISPPLHDEEHHEIIDSVTLCQLHEEEQQHIIDPAPNQQKPKSPDAKDLHTNSSTILTRVEENHPLFTIEPQEDDNESDVSVTDVEDVESGDELFPHIPDIVLETSPNHFTRVPFYSNMSIPTTFTPHSKPVESKNHQAEFTTEIDTTITHLSDQYSSSSASDEIEAPRPSHIHLSNEVVINHESPTDIDGATTPVTKGITPGDSTMELVSDTADFQNTSPTATKQLLLKSIPDHHTRTFVIHLISLVRKLLLNLSDGWIIHPSNGELTMNELLHVLLATFKEPAPAIHGSYKVYRLVKALQTSLDVSVYTIRLQLVEELVGNKEPSDLVLKLFDHVIGRYKILDQVIDTLRLPTESIFNQSNLFWESLLDASPVSQSVILGYAKALGSLLQENENGTISSRNPNIFQSLNSALFATLDAYSKKVMNESNTHTIISIPSEYSESDIEVVTVISKANNFKKRTATDQKGSRKLMKRL
ncbi:hypothetical protein HDV02_002091 [Globomyces sp. JEL0801]|nr:hypothetical protein HDV02_002091 [Globomyces sp. JEL0801]